MFYTPFFALLSIVLGACAYQGSISWTVALVLGACTATVLGAYALRQNASHTCIALALVLSTNFLSAVTGSMNSEASSAGSALSPQAALAELGPVVGLLICVLLMVGYTAAVWHDLWVHRKQPHTAAQ